MSESSPESSAAGDVNPLRQLPQEYVAEFPLARLERFPGNPKTHDLGLIDESFDANGWFGAILAQRRKYTPGGTAKARIVAGHGRFDQLRARGVSHAPVILLDCDDETARRIVAIDNRASERGGTDDALLVAFLQDTLKLTGALTGTGYDGDDLDALVRQLQPPAFGEATADEQGKLDQTAPIECPKCHHTWHKK